MVPRRPVSEAVQKGWQVKRFSISRCRRGPSLRSRVYDGDLMADCEVHFYGDQADPSSEGRDLLIVNLPADERVVERAFAELKLVAKEYGLRLHDPQTGDDVDLSGHSRLPEMF